MWSLLPIPDRILAAAFWINWELLREFLGHNDNSDRPTHDSLEVANARSFFFLHYSDSNVAEQTKASSDHVELMTQT